MVHLEFPKCLPALLMLLVGCRNSLFCFCRFAFSKFQSLLNVICAELFVCRCAGLFCNASEFWQITNHFSFNFASSTEFIRLFLFFVFHFLYNKKMWWKYFWKRKQRIASHKWLDFVNANHISCQLMCMQVRQSQLEVINGLFTYFQWLQQRIICDLQNQLRVLWSFQLGWVCLNAK